MHPRSRRADPPSPLLPRSLAIGVSFSVLLHLGLLSLLSRPAPPPAPQAMRFELLAPRTMRELSAPKQMVSPPEVPPSEPATQPALNPYLSDRDVSTTRETIKRGLPDAAPVIGTDPKPPAPRAARPEKQPRPRTEAPAKARAPGQPLKTLALDSATLLRDFSPKGDATTAETQTNPLASQPKTAPFSRPTGSGARFLGLSGSADYLPNLPDGDLTLLNTKANLYAVFVRRVATQVFAELRQQGWESISANQVNQINDFCTVRATLSATGKLLSVELLEPSGSPSFDELVVRAARTATRDPNPPPGAQSPDGTIRFIFKSKSWSQLSPDNRRGIINERRWLLLGTGLE